VFESADIVQGYSPWHPDVVTPFYQFLDDSGLQAAWGNLTNDDGTFKREISPAFCLTTNYSIKRQLALNEPFNEVFSGASWEDVELGYRLAKYNNALKAVFNFSAINHHHHRYDLDSFVERCRMEGYHRITICKIHPEMGWGLVNPFDLRAVEGADEYEILKFAKELDGVTNLSEDESKDIQVRKYQRYAEVCKVFSLKGVLARIDDEHPAMEALKHVHGNAQTIQILSGVAALESGHFGFAKHCAEWYMAEREDDWSAHSFNGEVEMAIGNNEEAVASFRKALVLAPGAKWPKKSLGRLLD
jgi:tetratricopeptide (TPR) repeat protein